MTQNTKVRFFGIAVICFSVAFAGCGDKSKSSSSSGSESSGGSVSRQRDSRSSRGQAGLAKSKMKMKNRGGTSDRRPIRVGGSSRGTITLTGGTNSGGGNAGYKNAAEALQPLQVVIGSWRGETRRPVAGFEGLETPEWKWDFSDKSRPALVLVSKTSSFLKKARLTYLEDSKEYELTAIVGRKGTEKTYRGNFSEPVRNESQDGKKRLQRTFKLSLTQVKPVPRNREPLFKVEFQQRDNNRYWLIVHRKAGKTVRQTDIVGNQRQGTQFAAAPDDYGDKTCVVSQGLGTIPVSFNGQTYYVCCSGCKAAFEEEPQKWIASFNKWKKKKNGK